MNIKKRGDAGNSIWLVGLLIVAVVMVILAANLISGFFNIFFSEDEIEPSSVSSFNRFVDALETSKKYNLEQNEVLIDLSGDNDSIVIIEENTVMLFPIALGIEDVFEESCGGNNCVCLFKDDQPVTCENVDFSTKNGESFEHTYTIVEGNLDPANENGWQKCLSVIERSLRIVCDQNCIYSLPLHQKENRIVIDTEEYYEKITLAGGSNNNIMDCRETIVDLEDDESLFRKFPTS